MTLDWDGFAAGTTIFTTIYFTEAWDANQSRVQAHPDGVGGDIRQMLSMTDLFRPGLDDARSQLAAWRQSLLDLFGQVDLLAPAGHAGIPAPAGRSGLRLAARRDHRDHPVHRAFQRGRNALHCTAHPGGGHPHTGRPAARRSPREARELLLATARQVEAAG